MNRLILILVFVIFESATPLSEVDKACIDCHTNDLNNDFLIGTWYEIYKFSYRLNLPTILRCVKVSITKAKPADIQRYTDFYTLENPYNFTENPVLVERDFGNYVGMLLGHKEAKFHIYDPENYFAKKDLYEARVFEKVNEDYILFQKCFMRGNTKWLMSRKNDTTDEELAEVLKIIHPKVKRYETQRFVCTSVQRNRGGALEYKIGKNSSCN